MKDKNHKQKGIIWKNPKWLDELRYRIEKGFGRKCKEFSYGCSVCGVWLAYEILVDMYGWEYEKTGKNISK